jgi:tetratricopeptide (TPR) repeat protein
MVASMVVQNLGDAFRVLMDRNGWSASRLARTLGTSQPWVSMVLAGRRDPGVRRSAELLARSGWELVLVPSEADDPVKRRAFLLAAAGAGAAAALPPGTASPYSDPGYVDMLTARLAWSSDQMGGTPLAAEAARHAARVIPAARRGGPALRASASRLCRQSALILNDVRQLDRAAQAAAAAADLGDMPGQARALDTLSLIITPYDGARGAGYARRGLALADVPDADRAVLSARLGRALALTGDARHARASLDRALELAGPSAEIYGNVGIGLTDLGLPGKAGPYLAGAVRLSAASPFVRSLYVSRQAKAAIRAKRADEAAQDMMTLASLVPLVDSPRLGFHLRHILDGTRDWDAIGEVRDARDALKEVA